MLLDSPKEEGPFMSEKGTPKIIMQEGSQENRANGMVSDGTRQPSLYRGQDPNMFSNEKFKLGMNDLNEDRHDESQ